MGESVPSLAASDDASSKVLDDASSEVSGASSPKVPDAASVQVLGGAHSRNPEKPGDTQLVGEITEKEAHEAHPDDPEAQPLSKQKLRSIVNHVRQSQRERVNQHINKAPQDALSRFDTQANAITHGMSQIQEKAEELLKIAIDNEYRHIKADKRGDPQSRLENALAEHLIIEKVDGMLEDFSKSMLPESQTKE
ncbi:hypothetical protein LZ31DRAFT_542323 [Colletotrichum somersetense]|nr:hypothetical protein LZ31DRAFT_542323 [Colletotrichum somersetense]